MQNSTNCVDLQDPFPSVVTLAIIDAIIALVAIIGNSVVILSVVRFPTLRTNTNTFVVSLAVADLLVGIFIPYYVVFYFDHIPWRCDRNPCLLRYFVILYPTISSMISNIGAAFERYIAVVHPLSYHRIMDTGWAVKSIVISWIYVGVVTALPLLGLNIWENEFKLQCLAKCKECDLRYIVGATYTVMAVACHVFFTLIITLALYYRIFREAWKQLRCIGSMENNKSIKHEAKTSRMMVLVLGVCLLGLAPYLVAIMYPIVNRQEKDSKSLSSLKKWAVCFYLGKSSFNPLIYGWKNKDFRNAFLRLLKTDKRKEFYIRRGTNQTQRASAPMFTVSTLC